MVAGPCLLLVTVLSLNGPGGAFLFLAALFALGTLDRSGVDAGWLAVRAAAIRDYAIGRSSRAALGPYLLRLPLS